MEDRQRLLNDENRVTKGVEWTSRLSANQQNSRGKNKAIYDFNNGNDASKREERSNKIYHTEALFATRAFCTLQMT